MQRAQGRIDAERAEIAALLHDLRGPLVTTHSYLELLAGEAFGPLSAAALGGVHRAAAATARAQTLASSMAAPARERSVANETTAASAANGRGTVELSALLPEVLDALAGEVNASGAAVSLGTLPAVHGERDALYRVFANLIENALKFAEPGSAPRIAILPEHYGGRTVIAVRDWGIGIPEPEREQVFEAMTRGSGVAGRPGSGLGLATVRRLVRAQGGEIWVAGHTTVGACIHMVLPRG